MKDAELASMRRDWSDGERRLAAARVRDPARAATYDRVVAELRRNLRRKIGQTFSLAELAAVYGRSAGWTRDVAQRAAPGAAYAQDLAVTADAVFAEASRQASDWTP